MKNKLLIKTFLAVFLNTCFFIIFFIPVSASTIPADNIETILPSICNIFDQTPDTEKSPYVSYLESQIKTGKGFESAVEATRKKYHTDTNKSFNDLFKKMQSSYGPYAKKPKQNACDINTKPINSEEKFSSFGIERINALHNYQCALLKYHLYPSAESNGNMIIDSIRSVKNTETLLLQEIQDAEAALVFTLQSYEQMYYWYSVHEQMECTIFQLENYRNALGKFITQVSRIPSEFFNAGDNKPK